MTTRSVSGWPLSVRGAVSSGFGLDYADPAGATLTVAVARRSADDPDSRLGTLVVETGGPGPSRDGVSLLLDGPEGGHAGAELGRHYDLIGMDPRFFGASSPEPVKIFV